MLQPKRMLYVRLDRGWQTYLSREGLSPRRYKFLSTPEELHSCIEACQEKGWKVINGTNLVSRLNQRK